MKMWLALLFLPLLLTGAEYVFLTPQTVVVKNPRPDKYSSHEVAWQGLWKKENGLLRDNSGKILRQADTTTYEFITLKNPLKSGEKVHICGQTMQYDPAVPTPVFKLNQLGNPVGQKKKYAYMGAWCGTAGALPLKHLAGKVFEIRSSDHKTVFTGKLQLRREDPKYQERIPFTGEEVLELDYSNFNTPGKYYFFVDGIGRSMDFTIGASTVNEAFYIHARGLYHKRCGIAREKPYTHWTASACHRNVFQGSFPGNDAHYRKGGSIEEGFVRNFQRIEVKHFDLIKRNILPDHRKKEFTAPGGWHDAADYDRRPYHLRIVSDLAAVYLMKPENFVDGQLHIPESGNGIPDVLDEAAWGVKHLLAVQQENGGVGTWFETTGHPIPGDGMPDQDQYTYYVSAPGRNSSLEYAAAVSTLALAMKKAGQGAMAEKYSKSAEKAWTFALDRKNILARGYMYHGKMVYYCEGMTLDAGNLLKAGTNLFLFTGDKKYLDPILAEQKRILETLHKDFWRWSPLSLMPLALEPVKELADMASAYRDIILRNADQMLADQENAYPYRTLWHHADAGWVHAMAWGNYPPLRRAMTLIAAHKLTGEEKYLTGAYLANDFHNGANPLGRTMTSGLGKVYPVVFLDLISYADNIGEFVPGITPYGNTFGLDRNAVKMVYGDKADLLPIWHRYVNLEFLSVPASEYSVWETIAPAAVTTGYLIEKAALPTDELKNRQPAGDCKTLPGYRALP